MCLLEDESETCQPQRCQLLLAQARDLLAAQEYRAGVGLVHTAQAVQEGGLPGPGGPHDGDELPLLDIQVEVSQDGGVVALGQVLGPQNRLPGSHGDSRSRGC